MSARAPWGRVRVRVLLWCAASAAVHAAVLGLIVVMHGARIARPPAAPALTVSLAPAAGSASEAAAPALPAPLAPSSAALPTATSAPQSSASTHGGKADASAPVPAAASTGAASGWDIAPGGDDASTSHTPGFQAVQPPPSKHLDYQVTIREGSQAPIPAGSASLDWQQGDQGYELRLAGSAGPLGELASRGQMTDNGFVPITANANAATIAFDWTTARATFQRNLLPGAVTAPITADTQDRASMLMRLAAIGAAGAHQFDKGIELLVAGSNGLARVTFEKAGEEALSTPLGELTTLHLRQKADANASTGARAPILEIWLAPQHHWYPVQLRLTEPTGKVTTQTITAIGTPTQSTQK